MKETVSDQEMSDVLDCIDEESGKTVKELSNLTGYPKRRVQHILEALMDRGRITSTPGWRYRESRSRHR